MELFEESRKAMIDSQIKTAGVTNENIIEALAETPRELFVPERIKPICYLDEDISLGKDSDGFFMAPGIFAKMLQETEPDQSDIVLNVGDDTGYSTAILSRLVTTVVVVEQLPGFYDKARQVWSELGLCNIAIVDGYPESGGLDHAPYSLIQVNGSVSRIPDSLIDQLTENGRLCTILRESPQKQGQAVVVQRVGARDRSIRIAFDASTPYLPLYKPQEAFVF